MTEGVDQQARRHLLRDDQQEDICFALWNPSRGRSRTTALVERLIMPGEGDRNVHGNASFNPIFFQRALAEAAAAGAGLALLHSHPLGRGAQGMSPDDVLAEHGHAAAAFGATDLPFVGLTLASDGAWSARFWPRTAAKTYERRWCASVRVVGEQLAVTYVDQLAPPPPATRMQVRTVSAWGEESQANLARLRVGVIGAGSVGGFIAEAMARTGFEDVMLIDFDHIEEHNLDRLLFASQDDIGKKKVDVLAERLKVVATANTFRVESLDGDICDEASFRAALDCDVLVACVDRPWGRHIANFIAYAHLIPVIDGGINVRANRLGKLAAADWRAHTATVGRPCLQCLKQYDAALVQTERDGYLDDPEYIERLPDGHQLKARENVFAFSMGCASLQMLQLLALSVAPLERSNPGAQRYHFVGGFMAPAAFGECDSACLFPAYISKGDASGILVTGQRRRPEQ